MRILWSSDHHTLHPNTPTKHILNNLSTFLFKENDLAKTDMVIFGGDFFEKLVERPNPDIYLVEEWVTKFLLECKRHNVIPIWLEGTSSHDRGQPAHFKFNAPEGSKFQYFDTLCIQTYPELDNLSIMYVPDNMGTMTPDEIWEQALLVLGNSGLEKVDLIAFHGGFDFQLHPKARHKAHLLERWRTIVRYGIFAGHIHTPVQKDMLYTSGSFDRDKHGEEHPKGGFVIDLDLKKQFFNPVFWENKNALPYLTMTTTKEVTPPQLIKDLHTFIKKKPLPRSSHIRVMGGLAEVVDPVLKMLKTEYPYFHFKAENEREDLFIPEDEKETELTNITLGKDNLSSILLAEASDTFKLNGISEADALSVLGEFL